MTMLTTTTTTITNTAASPSNSDTSQDTSPLGVAGINKRRFFADIFSQLSVADNGDSVLPPSSRDESSVAGLDHHDENISARCGGNKNLVSRRYAVRYRRASKPSTTGLAHSFSVVEEPGPAVSHCGSASSVGGRTQSSSAVQVAVPSYQRRLSQTCSLETGPVASRLCAPISEASSQWQTTSEAHFRARRLFSSMRQSLQVQISDIHQLESQYGGVVRSQNAALVIQNAYRSFRIRSDCQQLIRKKREGLMLSNSVGNHDDQVDNGVVGNPIWKIAESDEVEQPTRATSDPKNCGQNLNRLRRKRALVSIFNRNPKKGLAYLIKENFLPNSVPELTTFLMQEKLLSRQAVGEYFGQLDNIQAQEIFRHFMDQLDFHGKPVDSAMRYFLTFFHIPGESQKILHLMQAFQTSYCKQNQNVMKFQDQDTVTVLCYAVLMLHTDWHNPNLGVLDSSYSRSSIVRRKRMTCEEFIRNLRGVDNGGDIDAHLLSGIYQRTVGQRFQTKTDPVDEVRKIVQSLSSSNSINNFAERHRRLVFFVSLNEVIERRMFSKPILKERCIFLFNDSLLVTKKQTTGKSIQKPTVIFKSFDHLIELNCKLVLSSGCKEVVSKRSGSSLSLNESQQSHDDEALQNPHQGDSIFVELYRVATGKRICRFCPLSIPSNGSHLGKAVSVDSTSISSWQSGTSNNSSNGSPNNAVHPVKKPTLKTAVPERISLPVLLDSKRNLSDSEPYRPAHNGWSNLPNKFTVSQSELKSHQDSQQLVEQLSRNSHAAQNLIQFYTHLTESIQEAQEVDQIFLLEESALNPTDVRAESDLEVTLL